MFNQITEICQDLLNNYHNASSVKDYLDSRISREAQNEFQMGYFPNSDELHLIKDIVNEEYLLKTGLFYYKFFDNDKVLNSSLKNHNMVMPYNDVYGEIIGLVGRSVLSDEKRKELKIPKYKNTSFSKKDNLFGLDKSRKDIIKENCAYVVEGQFDFIKAFGSGIKNCVCLGSSNMSVEQFSLLSKYTDNIILLLDNDAAGESGSNKIISNFGSMANIKKASVPCGYNDLDQFLTSEEESAREFILELAY